MRKNLVVKVAWTLSFLLVLGAGSCGGANLRAWQLDDDALTEVEMPEEAVQRPAKETADLDGDGAPETICLSEGVARIQAEPCESANTNPRWGSPESWQVTQFGLDDLDSSGLPEVSLLVWRPFEPWPIDQIVPNPGRIDAHQGADGLSCHVILIGWRDGRFREVWAGSALADPLLSMFPADLDGDGRPELAALESGYDDPPGGPARALTVWGWNGFGFDLLARAGGRFYGLTVYEVPGGSAYLVTR